jgi:hypothetical protein
MNNFIYALLVAQVAASDEELTGKSYSDKEWNYIVNGADWGEGCTTAGLTNQTPINLTTPGHKDFSYKKLSTSTDSKYYNQKSRKVGFKGYTSQIDLEEVADQHHGFKSDIPK